MFYYRTSLPTLLYADNASIMRLMQLALSVFIATPGGSLRNCKLDVAAWEDVVYCNGVPGGIRTSSAQSAYTPNTSMYKKEKVGHPQFLQKLQKEANQKSLRYNKIKVISLGIQSMVQTRTHCVSNMKYSIFIANKHESVCIIWGIFDNRCSFFCLSSRSIPYIAR